MKTRFTILVSVIALVCLVGCSGTADTSTTHANDNYYPEIAQSDDIPDEEATNQETYDESGESGFIDAAEIPVSTFSSDVDTASYSNLRRQVNSGIQPQGVRIEELVNYFDYDYPAPSLIAEHPFSVSTEVSDCPWNPSHQLAMIGVQATRGVPTVEGNNIVLLLDVSGSMDAPNKLPLLIDSFSLLVNTLGDDDVVSIVTYAGANKIVADSVPGSDHDTLLTALKKLTAGGSTAGAQGLRTAYELAEKNFIDGGNNRVILATDGDFNVGVSSVDGLTTLIEEERDSGVYISVLGFGMGNLKDATMEAIADHGNGNYAYIDTLNEAHKVLVDEFDSTMFVVAQDLKLQVEFNPGMVSQYRLIGYDNRRLADEDFTDDTKDAGDVGAGHAVTAFYELVPASAPTGDYFSVAVRYKQPGASESTEVRFPISAKAYSASPSTDFIFASAVAEFGLIAIDSEYKADANLEEVKSRATDGLGEDPDGLRQEFVTIVSTYEIRFG